jgi:hypothetical protein
MSAFFLVSNHADRNILDPGPLSGPSAGQWVPDREARPILGLFKCSWLYLGANLTGSYGVSTP